MATLAGARDPAALLSPYRHVGNLTQFDETGKQIDVLRGWTRLKAGLHGHLRALQNVVGGFRRGPLDYVNVGQLSDHPHSLYAGALWTLGMWEEPVP